MPEKYKRLVQHLKDKGKSEDEAYAIAGSVAKKQGWDLSDKKKPSKRGGLFKNIKRKSR
jgi:hypothetical protein